MPRSFATFVAQLLLLVYMTGLGSGAFNVGWLAHEIGHQLQPVAQLQAHSHVHDHESGDTDSAPLSDAEHSYLHAAVQLVAVVGLEFQWQAPYVTAANAPSFDVSPVAPAVPDPPFRPPRSQAA